MISAIFIGSTQTRSGRKHRWECPVCQARKAPECRFNISPKKTGGRNACRFCGTELVLALPARAKEASA